MPTYRIKRAALESVASVWAEVFHESSVNSALRARGERIALVPGVVVYQHRQGLTVGLALQERFVWGRSYAATRGALAPVPQRLFWLFFAPALPVLMLARMTVMAWKKRAHLRRLSPGASSHGGVNRELELRRVYRLPDAESECARRAGRRGDLAQSGKLRANCCRPTPL